MKKIADEGESDHGRRSVAMELRSDGLVDFCDYELDQAHSQEPKGVLAVWKPSNES
jgi:hypothetical protein